MDTAFRGIMKGMLRRAVILALAVWTESMALGMAEAFHSLIGAQFLTAIGLLAVTLTFVVATTLLLAEAVRPGH